MIRTGMKVALSCAVILSILAATASAAERVPLRVDLPIGSASDVPIPVAGGIPFPRSALKSVENVRLLANDGSEVPAQVTRLAVWPDGSVKWALIDAILTPEQGETLSLEYGGGVTRAPVEDPITAATSTDGVRVTGGGVEASVLKSGGGVVDELSLAGGETLASRLVLNTLRLTADTSGRALPTNTYVCADPSAKRDEGKVAIDEVSVESAGPVRVTVLIRGKVLLAHYGETLLDQMKQRDPAGQMPFSMRVSFYRNCPVVTGEHQIIFTGEPDCDYIADWGVHLSGLSARRGQLILEPGVELDLADGRASVAPEQTRLAWAPVTGGFALIREGWQNRPVGITRCADGARIDFWPSAAGVWDLRRYAREWGVGETGATSRGSDIQLYSRFAARGMAKSHTFVLYLGGDIGDGSEPGIVRSLSGRALLVAPPGWYGASNALGYFAPDLSCEALAKEEQTAGPFAEVDAGLRRTIDYYLFNQDLYRWYGKLAYGNWQSWNGNAHRIDRWERDFGRWGWGLNDGAGRIGHMVMLAYLRTLERRYFDAGEAFNRIIYDTNMVHTAQHFENATPNLWSVKGCAHRHDVQPFGCPYIGLRGSNPGGHRILYLLTGDGVIKDGLDMVAEASLEYAEGRRGRFGASGGSDGEGSGALALLWAYETTGEKKYLDAVGTILDTGGLIPPKRGRGLGYGPAFGLFNAAGEYADLTGDPEWKRRVIEVARMGMQQENPGPYLYTYAIASRLGGGGEFVSAAKNALAATAKVFTNTLAELPPGRWPGHGGRQTAGSRANVGRDIPYAIGVASTFQSPGPWPRTQPNLAPIPAKAPEDWYTPSGQPGPDDVPPGAEELLALAPSGTAGNLQVGDATWTVRNGVVAQVTVGGLQVLAGEMEPYALFVEPRDDDRTTKRVQAVTGTVSASGASPDGAVLAKGTLGDADFVLRLRPAEADGVPSVRVEMGLQAPADRRLATWGVRLLLRLGKDAQKIQMTAPGTFRVERWRVDQNDEKIPEWLLSDSEPRWPLWRIGGISLGPGDSYRIWKANRADTSPLFCDEGIGSPGWFDVTDRGGRKWWGVTVRPLRPAQSDGLSGQAVVARLGKGVLEVQFGDASRPPVDGSAGLAGAADVIFHDGWRPPLGKPDLTRTQYEEFMKDMDFGENYGLLAYRFNFSVTHKVTGPKRQWVDKLMEAGIEPREILYSTYPPQMQEFCRRIGVRYDPNDEEGTIRACIAHYRSPYGEL